jgi:protocatechuate 3,4-dioxygenase alpha subunit
MPLQPTASQTIGPFFAVMLPLGSNEIVPAGSPGAIRVEGQVLDGAGQPVTDALIEVWQANRHGRYHHPEDTSEAPPEPSFTGFGRCATDDDGRFSFVTVKPGPVPVDTETMQAPHLNVTVFARGLLNRLTTRLYFPDEPDANAADPVLSSIGDAAIRDTLIAREEGPGVLRFDIRLQGEGETAFFDV